MINQVQNYSLNFGAKYPRIPKPDLKECIRLGYTYKQMSEKFNVPMDVVGRSMQWYGLKSNRAAEIEKNTEDVLDLYKKGYPIRQIKSKLRVTDAAINRILKSVREEPKPQPDKTLEEVIKKLNMSEEEVKKYLK